MMRTTLAHATLPLAALLGGSLGCDATDGPVGDTSQVPARATVDRADLLDRVKPLLGIVEPVNTTDDPEVEAARVALGRALFNDERLSVKGDMSCNTCHDLQGYGVDVREFGEDRAPTSLGHEDKFGRRNAPTVYNAFAHVAQMWDGRAETVEQQAELPLTDAGEMAMPDVTHAVRVLRRIRGYRRLFAEAFPGDRNPVTFENFTRAIGAFERKLVTPGPFDEFLSGNLDALSEPEVRGLALFADRCIACHDGPALGGTKYQKMGVNKVYPLEDHGRFDVTRNEEDKGVFKVPSLRNVARTGPYLHDGSVKTLDEVIEIMGEYQTSQGPLTEQEIADLKAFLSSLTGDLPFELIDPVDVPGRRS